MELSLLLPVPCRCVGHQFHILARSGWLSKQIFLLNLLRVPPVHGCSRCLGLVLPSLAVLPTDPSLDSSSSASGRRRPSTPSESSRCVWGWAGESWGPGCCCLSEWEWVPMLLVAPCGSGELVGAALGVWMDLCFSETATFGGWWESDPSLLAVEERG